MTMKRALMLLGLLAGVCASGFSAASVVRPNLKITSGWATGESGWGAAMNTSLDNIDAASPMSVQAYGATPNDGSDDTTPFLDAIAALPAKSTLFVPAGTWNLSTWTAQTLTKEVRLIGAGPQATIIRVRGSASEGFLKPTKNISVHSLTIDSCGTAFDFSSVATLLDHVTFEDVEITNSKRGIYGSNTTAGAGVLNMRVVRCRIENMTQYGIYMILPMLADAQILDNRVRRVTERGIQFGNNTLAYAADRGRYVIRGNIVDSVTAIYPKSAVGILAYGWRAIIESNQIRDVFKDDSLLSPDLDGTDAEGIYTKCRFTTIAHNVLVDAGQSEGFINVKGMARTEVAVTSPYGYAVLVSDNVLIDTGTTGRKTKGIKVACSEAQITNNYIEGHTDVGIYTDGDNADNFTISGNFLQGIRGAGGIKIFGGGRGIIVRDNIIDSVTTAYNDTLQNAGIWIQKTGGSGVELSGNRIHAIRNMGNTPVGILIKPSGTLKDVRVVNNHIDRATYGIQFSNTAMDSVYVVHNSFRNIATDDIKYSTGATPTNLVENPIAAVVLYEAANDAAIKNGTNAQELRVYGTYTDASNYERLLLQTTSNDARIAHQYAGTGGAGKLIFQTDGSDRWSVGSTGTWLPENHNTYDVGSAGAKVRDVFATGMKVIGRSTSLVPMSVTGLPSTKLPYMAVIGDSATSDTLWLFKPGSVSSTGNRVAHLESRQSVAPTIAAGAALGDGPTVAVTAGGTDAAGMIELTAGTSPATGIAATVTFRSPYFAAPKCVIIGNARTGSAARQAYVSSVTTTTFVVSFDVAPVAATRYDFYYWVIE